MIWIIGALVLGLFVGYIVGFYVGAKAEELNYPPIGDTNE